MADLAGAALLDEVLDEALPEPALLPAELLAAAGSELVLAVAATELEVERESVR